MQSPFLTGQKNVLDLVAGGQGSSSPPDSESHSDGGAKLAAVLADNHELRALVEQLRSELGSVNDRMRRMIELIGAKGVDTVVHDLRNILNERDLLKALVDEM